MNTLTLKIPQSLNDALQLASARRQMSKSAMVREVLEKTLATELTQGNSASQWVKKWSGALADVGELPTGDKLDNLGGDRLAHLLKKHVH